MKTCRRNIFCRIKLSHMYCVISRGNVFLSSSFDLNPAAVCRFAASTAQSWFTLQEAFWQGYVLIGGCIVGTLLFSAVPVTLRTIRRFGGAVALIGMGYFLRMAWGTSFFMSFSTLMAEITFGCCKNLARSLFKHSNNRKYDKRVKRRSISRVQEVSIPEERHHASL